MIPIVIFVVTIFVVVVVLMNAINPQSTLADDINIENQLTLQHDEKTDSNELSEVVEPPSTIVGVNDTLPDKSPAGYPFILLPNKGTVVTPPVEGRSGRKGITEDVLRNNLLVHFSEQFSVVTNMSLSNDVNTYFPDITMISKSDPNLYIDIEIDEPYEGTNDLANRKPTHCETDDDKRDTFFAANGWYVVRFAEQQVAEQPLNCCRYLQNFISEHVLPDSNSIHQADDLRLVHRWNYTGAQYLSSIKHRERYLDIEQFGEISEEESLARDSEQLVFQSTNFAKGIDDEIDKLSIYVELQGHRVLNTARTGTPYVHISVNAHNYVCYLNNLVQPELEDRALGRGLINRRVTSSSGKPYVAYSFVSYDTNSNDPAHYLWRKKVVRDRAKQVKNTGVFSAEVLGKVHLTKGSQKIVSGIIVTDFLTSSWVSSQAIVLLPETFTEGSYLDGYCTVREVKTINSTRYNNMRFVELLQYTSWEDAVRS